jgi:pimeloyl-ACP methyl ester carboxylesterase
VKHAGEVCDRKLGRDLAGLLSEINVDSVDIIGQSDGGILALLLAIRHPSKVKKIVANCPNIRPNGQAGWNFRYCGKCATRRTR